MSRRDLYFAVESGATLELARKHVAERIAAIGRNAELLEPLGVKKYIQSYSDGTVVGVEFEGKIHRDFKKPNRRGISFPKAKTEWADKFSKQTGYDRRGFDLAESLGIPTTISYTSDESRGCGAIAGFGFTSGVGFLYLSADGPFALYLPDIAQVVAEYESQGYTVDENCKSFVPQFDGARPILKEEWELIVARHKLAQAEQAVEA